jgi:RNA polymerase sigma-B factor
MAATAPENAAPNVLPLRAAETSGRWDAHELIRRWRRTGDPRWRNRAIEAYMPLARRIARRYANGPESLDDLSQVAYVGLVKAVERFDPDAGTRFGSYAIPTISGELRRHFRDTSWSVHLPRGLQEDVLRVRNASAALADRLGRSPTVGELSEATGLDAEQVVEALQAAGARDAASLDQPLVGVDGEAGESLGSAIGAADDGFDLVEHRATISPLLRALPQRDREMLFMRFAHDMTQTEIAERLGCSQMQVSRLLRRAIERLGMVEHEPTDALSRVPGDAVSR